MSGYEFEEEIFHKLAREEALTARTRIASSFELITTSFISFCLIYLAFSDAARRGEDPARLLITDPRSIIAFALIFLQGICLFLSRYTILVGAATNIAKNPFPILRAFVQVLPWSSGAIALDVAKDMTAGVAQRLSRNTENLVENTAVDRLRSNIFRSVSTAKSAQLRPNALIFIGSSISVLGILLFIATLPAPEQLTEDWYRRALEVIPRIVLFLFVQVLAGFFLRQYRTSLEDYRYYERVLRLREDQLATYFLLKENNNIEALNEFAKKLTEDRDMLKISQGETSFVLEMTKVEKNEFSSVADVILNLLKQNEKETK